MPTTTKVVATCELRRILSQFPPTRVAFGYGSGVYRQRGYDIDTIADDGAGGEDIGSDDATSTAAANLPMIDLVFVVDDAVAWHRANLHPHGYRNSHHYSLPLRIAGASAVATLQRTAAGVYYNTHVRCRHTRRLIKYGVVTAAALYDDCQRWRTLYLAGRLHKPVHVIRDATTTCAAVPVSAAVLPPPTPSSAAANAEMVVDTTTTTELQRHLARNCEHAFHTALLLLLTEGKGGDGVEDDTATTTTTIDDDIDLYTTIAALSYTGDVRMGVAEHPDKVRNIVSGNVAAFRTLYAPLVTRWFTTSTTTTTTTTVATTMPTMTASGVATERVTLSLRRPLCRHTRAALLADAPLCVRHELLHACDAESTTTSPSVSAGSHGSSVAADSIGRVDHPLWRRLAAPAQARSTAEHVSRAVGAIVRVSSLRQSAKGVLTAGMLTSLRYVAAKVGKRFS